MLYSLFKLKAEVHIIMHDPLTYLTIVTKGNSTQLVMRCSALVTSNLGSI